MEKHGCNSCKELYEQLEGNFPRSSITKSGYVGKCNKCTSEYQSKWWKERFGVDKELRPAEIIDAPPLSNKLQKEYIRILNNLNDHMAFKPRIQSWSTIKANNNNFFKNLDK